MTKEKLASLQRYLDLLNNRMTSLTPVKHLGHESAYREYLKHEIELVKTKLELTKLEGK